MAKKKWIALMAMMTILMGLFWMNRTEPKPPDAEPTDDAGFTRFQTEEMMREIGYVQ